VLGMCTHVLRQEGDAVTVREIDSATKAQLLSHIHNMASDGIFTEARFARFVLLVLLVLLVLRVVLLVLRVVLLVLIVLRRFLFVFLTPGIFCC
jgi:hypothetical protein